MAELPPHARDFVEAESAYIGLNAELFDRTATVELTTMEMGMLGFLLDRHLTEARDPRMAPFVEGVRDKIRVAVQSLVQPGDLPGSSS